MTAWLRSLRLALVGTVLAGCATAAPRVGDGAGAADAARPRVVVTTDPELDDSNTLLRYLLYSTDFRTEGLVYASSQYHWKGDGTVNPASRSASAPGGAGGAAPPFDAFMRSLESIGPEGPSVRPPSPEPDFTPAAQNGFAAASGGR